MDNPFEKYDLDPRDGIAAITQRLKELAEDARTERERDEIRAAWEELTLHPARRLRAAVFAHPDTRAPLAGPPPMPRMRAGANELALSDLAARPSILSCLSDPTAAVEDRPPPLEDDPLL